MYLLAYLLTYLHCRYYKKTVFYVLPVALMAFNDPRKRQDRYKTRPIFVTVALKNFSAPFTDNHSILDLFGPGLRYVMIHIRYLCDEVHCDF